MRIRLGEFIRANIEPILVEWEAFARTLLPGRKMDAVALRDHARAILLASVRDMASVQSESQRTDKSTGHGQDSAHSEALDGASGQHAVSRVEAGFDMMELVSEYRALRASVVRLWQDSLPAPDHRDLQDLTRFNESMDQSLATAVQDYSWRVDETRNTFLAILGHDLRSPLATILMAASARGMTTRDPEETRMSAVMVRSARAMDDMIEDLLQYAASTLGTRIPLERAETDLLGLCQEVADETRAANPECTIHLQTDTPVHGNWDRGRLRQVVSNLVNNAVNHGADDSPIDITVRSDSPEAVRLSVRNRGEPIPAQLLPRIFQPMVCGGNQTSRNGKKGLGLGLAIVDRVVRAHGGHVEVASERETGTTFTVHLPRND